MAARWYQMGVALGTPVGDLEIIRVRKLPPTESEALMLKAWLMNGNMKTWQWLVDSVGHVAGGNHLKLAKELAKKKPSGTVEICSTTNLLLITSFDRWRNCCS